MTTPRRFYAFDAEPFQGRPHIIAEFVSVTLFEYGIDDDRAYVLEVWGGGREQFMTAEELMAFPEGAAALQAWKAGDDAEYLSNCMAPRNRLDDETLAYLRSHARGPRLGVR